MRYYIGIVHKDKGSAYGVHFPDVPGCYSAADEMDDLHHNASEALALMFEDMDEPRARSIDELKASGEIDKDLAEGAFLVAVPHIQLSGRSTRANITMDAGLLEAVDQTAKKRGLTRSSFLADLARRELAG